MGVGGPSNQRSLNFFAKNCKKIDGGSPGHCKETNTRNQKCDGAEKRKRKAENWEQRGKAIPVFRVSVFRVAPYLSGLE